MKDGEKNMANYQRGNAANIVVGAAALFVSQIDKLVDSTSFDPSKPGPGFNNTIVPDFVLGTSYKDTLANATTNWRNVGYTNNGLELTFNPTFGDVTVDQLLDAGLQLGDRALAAALGEHLQHRAGLVKVQVGQDGRDDLRVFVADQFGQQVRGRNRFSVEFQVVWLSAQGGVKCPGKWQLRRS